MHDCFWQVNIRSAQVSSSCSKNQRSTLHILSCYSDQSHDKKNLEHSKTMATQKAPPNESASTRVGGSTPAWRGANCRGARLIIRKSQQRLSREHFSYLLTKHLNNNAAIVNHACIEAKKQWISWSDANCHHHLYVRQSRDPVCSMVSFYATLDNASNTLTLNYAKIKIFGKEKL
jgi:hypothetical protein